MDEWDIEEKKKLALVVMEHVEMQKAYGRVIDAKTIMRAWQRKFINRFTVDQIIYALDKYSDKHDDFPSPSNIIDILEPEQPKVTEAAFIEAQKWQEKNGWPMFSDAQITIDRYRKQNKEAAKIYKIECEKVAQIVNGAVKQIST